MGKRARVFGMINMQRSWEYTSYALKTFAKNTEFLDDDLFVLIDDDASFGGAPDWILPRVQVLENSSPCSFAYNINAVMELAHARDADLYIFHNDIIFTNNWSEPFSDDRSSIVVAQSNCDLQYEIAGFTWQKELILTDYTKRAPFLKDVVTLHRTHLAGFRSILASSFFCVKISREVYQTIGELDRGYGRMGGEAQDYCLKAIERGFKVEQALSTYVLHFGSKSTEGGGERKAESEQRIATYRKVFEQRWGNKLLRLIFDNQQHILQETPELLEAWKSADYKKIIAILK